MEGWPSGLRHLLGKQASPARVLRGFESHSFRHFPLEEKSMSLTVKNKDVIAYSDLRDAVEKVLSEREGRIVHIRDYFDKYRGPNPSAEAEYADFWHFWLDQIDQEVSNDTISFVEWSDAYADLMLENHPKWISTILNAFNEVLLTAYTQQQLNEGINIEYSW